ncbi:TlpA family protein disulfide reductase [Fulvivirga sediminis]|uniref:TlpA family protein disulfide reductase n=1 Tax=Fulvivirga sediminis TaxID=2803949 RepID=A0A937FCQ6_9BACT|nr:TlpA disulfide reductase family protein [Fulvivirga sediminis]MBL3658138.1 TlpA family protein disulfide reductase [Fulvivirga sediminis]
MTNFILTATLILFSLSVQSQPNLSLKFDDIASGKVFLINKQNELIDTLLINSGNVTYDAIIPTPTLFYLIVDGYNTKRPLPLVLSDQLTEIEFKNFKEINENSVNEAYPNRPFFVLDPNNNAAFYEFLSNWKHFYNLIEKLSENDSPEQLEKRKNAYDSFLSQNKQIIKSNSDQYISAIIIDFLLRNNLLQIETLQEYYDELSLSVKGSYMGFKIGEKAGNAGRLQPGQPAPLFELTDSEGKNYNQQSLTGKNVLLHFWSSSCAPCIKEAPDLLKLSRDYANNLVVINISLDTDNERWITGIEKAGIGHMINVCDMQGLNSVIAKSYDVTFIPVYYLIDTNGNISLKGTLEQVTEKAKNGMP